MNTYDLLQYSIFIHWFIIRVEFSVKILWRYGCYHHRLASSQSGQFAAQIIIYCISVLLCNVIYIILYLFFVSHLIRFYAGPFKPAVKSTTRKKVRSLRSRTSEYTHRLVSRLTATTIYLSAVILPRFNFCMFSLIVKLSQRFL